VPGCEGARVVESEFIDSKTDRAGGGVERARARERERGRGLEREQEQEVGGESGRERDIINTCIMHAQHAHKHTYTVYV
jgi:hypothetical protein